MHFKPRVKAVSFVLVAGIAATSGAQASSHREAPYIAGNPRVDGTDFYMFRSYEAGRSDYLTIIANYNPLQDAYGGPNYFSLDPNALYEVMIDNNGDAREDLTFQFRISNTYNNITVDSGNGKLPIPLINAGQISAGNTAALNLMQTYTITEVKGDRRSGTAAAVTGASGTTSFTKPADYIGTKSFPDYTSYANSYIYSIALPGCSTQGRVFVGQRREGFVVNLGQVFDLVNLNPLGARDSASNEIGNKNITSFALELPIACLTSDGKPASSTSQPILGAWMTASLHQGRVLNPAPTGPNATANGKGPSVEGGAWTQVSRLGSPLVNEVVIGITDKDKFNASSPKDDLANFASYVQYPTLPVLVQALFGLAPPATPRTDLVAAFVTGITATVNGSSFNFTQPKSQTGVGEMLRLNTAIAPTTPDTQSDLGFLGCDLAGFPNGRRPIDDVVDIELSVAEGAITAANPYKLQTCDVSGATPKVVNAGAVVNDGALPNASDYLTSFPYLATPLPGATSGG